MKVINVKNKQVQSTMDPEGSVYNICKSSQKYARWSAQWAYSAQLLQLLHSLLLYQSLHAKCYL